MKAGANTVQRLEFTLRHPQTAQQEALREAAKQARASAETIASALGLRITRILSVDESPAEPIRPLPVMAAMAGGPGGIAPAPPTPIETGAIEVRARVSIAAEIAQ
jgi:uncharacterized protein YggE